MTLEVVASLELLEPIFLGVPFKAFFFAASSNTFCLAASCLLARVSSSMTLGVGAFIPGFCLGASLAAGCLGASFVTGFLGASLAAGCLGTSFVTGFLGASLAAGCLGVSFVTGFLGASLAAGCLGVPFVTGFLGSSLAPGFLGASLSSVSAAPCFAFSSATCKACSRSDFLLASFCSSAAFSSSAFLSDLISSAVF